MSKLPTQPKEDPTRPPEELMQLLRGVSIGTMTESLRKFHRRKSKAVYYCIQLFMLEDRKSVV